MNLRPTPATGGERLRRARLQGQQRTAQITPIAGPSDRMSEEERARVASGLRVGLSASSRVPQQGARQLQAPPAAQRTPQAPVTLPGRLTPAPAYRPLGPLPPGATTPRQPVDPNPGMNVLSGGPRTNRTGESYDMDGTYTREAAGGGPFQRYTGEGAMRTDVPAGRRTTYGTSYPAVFGGMLDAGRQAGAGTRFSRLGAFGEDNPPAPPPGDQPKIPEGFLGTLEAARNAAAARATAAPEFRRERDPLAVPQQNEQPTRTVEGPIATESQALTAGNGNPNAQAEADQAEADQAEIRRRLEDPVTGLNARNGDYIAEDGTVYIGGVAQGKINDPTTWSDELAEKIGYGRNWTYARSEAKMDQEGIPKDPVLRDMLLEIDNSPKFEIDWNTGNIIDSDTGTVLGNAHDPPETWAPNSGVGAIVKGHKSDPENSHLYEDKEKSEKEQLEEWWAEIQGMMPDAPKMDQGSLDAQIDAMRADEARQRALALQAMMERGSRMGMSPEAATAAQAQMQHEGGTKTALQASTMQLEGELRNFAAEMQHYQNQYASLMAVFQRATTAEQQKLAFDRAMIMQQAAANAQSEMQRVQYELQNRITGKDVLGGILGLGTTVAGAATGGLTNYLLRGGQDAASYGGGMGQPASYGGGYWDPGAAWYPGGGGWA